MAQKIVIIEDDEDIAEMITYNLHKAGYEAIIAADGEEGLTVVLKEHPDIVLLDLMLPKINGLEVCKLLRQEKMIMQIPIIMITAKTQEADKLRGFEYGADDYVTKPFSPRELLARIKAVLRRTKPSEGENLVQKGTIVINKEKHKVTVGGGELFLTITEFKLLDLLMQHPGIVLSRETLLRAALGYDSGAYDRTIDAHIKSLRKKLGTVRDHIETVRGVGYKFKEM